MIFFVGCLDELLPLIKFAYNNSYHATIQMTLFETLYGRRCGTPVFWEEVGTQQLMGPKLVQVTNAVVQKLKSRILTAQSRQKSYASIRRKDVKFAVGEHVLLKVVPMRGVLRFGKMGKLSSKFIGPFEILEKIDVMAYRLVATHSCCRSQHFPCIHVKELHTRSHPHH